MFTCIIKYKHAKHTLKGINHLFKGLVDFMSLIQNFAVQLLYPLPIFTQGACFKIKVTCFSLKHKLKLLKPKCLCVKTFATSVNWHLFLVYIQFSKKS